MLKISKVYLRLIIYMKRHSYSIFNVSLLYAFIIGTLFFSLDRMPPQLGDFISQAVYEGKLKSNPLHLIKDDIIACHFVDVMSGRERQNGSKSFSVSFIHLEY